MRVDFGNQPLGIHQRAAAAAAARAGWFQDRSALRTRGHATERRRSASAPKPAGVVDCRSRNSLLEPKLRSLKGVTHLG